MIAQHVHSFGLKAILAVALIGMVSNAIGDTSEMRATAGAAGSSTATTSITHGVGVGNTSGDGPDSDGDGMPDSWEDSNGLDPQKNDADSDDDDDGLTNVEEFEAGTNPFNAYSDADSVKDGEDGWPLDAGLFTPRLSSPSYAIIDLGAMGFFAALNLGDGGHVVGWMSSGGQGMLNDGKVVYLPQTTSDVGNTGSWGSVDKMGGVVREYLVDDQAEYGKSTILKYSNGVVQTVLEGYLAGLSGENQKSDFHLSITSNSGSIFAIVSQICHPAEKEAITRYGVIKLNGSTIVELPDFITIRYQESGTILTPDQPLNPSWLEEANDQGQVVGIAHRVSLSDRAVHYGPTVMCVIDGNSVYELSEGLYQLSLSEGPDALVSGYTDEGFTIWRKTNGWTKVISQSSPSAISGYPRSINARGELVGNSFSQSGRHGGTLVRNGRVYDLSELNTTHIIADGLRINESGLILAWGRPKTDPEAPYTPCLLLPFEVISDLNNNGMIDGGDRTAKSNGAKSGATDEEKEKATEYFFANDNLSNGAWDKDDTDPNKPQNYNDDDDIEELSLTCAATWGAVWFEHPAIEKLSFYKTKECLPADKVTFPFALSDQESGKLPEKLYVRLDGADFTAQAEGDLVMKFGKADKSETWAEDKLQFTIVKHFGDKKFFEAARDYIMERNTRLFAHVKDYGSGRKVRMVLMREEAASMKALDTFWLAQPLWGIDEVVGAASSWTAIINSNFVFDIQSLSLLKKLTRRCHGRLVTGGVYQTNVSSDNDDRNIPAPGDPLKGSVLAGPEGKYIAMQSPHSFTIAKGRVPIASPPQEALGGWHTDYGNGNQHVMVGIGKTKLDQRLLFTLHITDGTGFTEDIANDAKESGVPDLPGGNSGNLMLILGDASTSEALAYRTASDQLKVYLKGLKHTVPSIPGTSAYCINTYLLFHCEKPRP